jgi:hypothetical protein
MEISECTVFEFCQLLRACSAGARGADLLSRCLCFPVTSFGSQWGDHRMTGSRGWHPSAEPRSGSRTDQLGLPANPQVRTGAARSTRNENLPRAAHVPQRDEHPALRRSPLSARSSLPAKCCSTTRVDAWLRRMAYRDPVLRSGGGQAPPPPVGRHVAPRFHQAPP